MEEILLNYIQQIFSTIGLIVLFGLFFSLCRKLFCSLLGSVSYIIINYVTGWIGTPVHELSHAFFNIIFGHKITEIDLYSPNDGDDSLGYVKFNYNDKNVFHLIGLFFTGIGPILGGGVAILLLMLILVPDLFYSIMSSSETVVDYSNILNGYFNIFEVTITNVFDPNNMNNILYWLFMILAIMIAAHMELSIADISLARIGIGILLVFILIGDIILYLISPDVVYLITESTTYFALFMGTILIMGAFFNLLLILIALFVYCIKRFLLGKM